MAEKNPVDTPRATPLEAGDPVEAPMLSQMGGTFAERAKAREAATKQVTSDEAEDKAVTKKRATTKKS